VALDERMRIGAVIQARMTSQRLPGKVLRQICGKPALGYVLESVQRSLAIATVVVATSSHQSDDAIVDFCENLGVQYHRGPLDDVVERVAQAVVAHGLDCFFRVCGDSPLLDHRLLDQALSVYTAGEYDLVTNVMPRTFPAGESVELVRTAAFDAARAGAMTAKDREHVTQYFYRHRASFRIGTFKAPYAWQAVRLVLDTPEDLAVIEDILSKMDKPHWEYDLAALMRLHPLADLH
jgi:spore coat polysaccharide biosynthesis protein SpsF